MKIGMLISAAVLVALATAPVRAQDDAEWRQEMERKMDALTRELERRDIGEAAAEPVYEGRHGLAPAASKVYHVKRGVSVGGYGEMVYQNFSSERDNGAASGRKDELDFLRAILYIGHRFSDRILFNSEIEFEHATTGGGAGARGEVSVEFAYLDFMPLDNHGIRAGMVLIPVGLTNEMHEPTLFHGSRRPSVESDIIPTTWRENGVGIFGHCGPLQYRAYAVAGLQGVTDTTPGLRGFTASQPLRNARSKGAKSQAEDIALTGRVDYEGIPGTLIGVSGYRGNAGQDSMQAGEDIDGTVTLWDVHGTAEYKGVEVKGLYAKGKIDDVALLNAANGLTGSSSIGEEFFGGYLEVAYDILPLFGSKHYLAPFFRWERLDSQQGVPSGFSESPATDRTEYTYGLTYKPHPNTVIKADVQNIDNKANTGVDQVNMAVGYLF